MPPTAGPPVVVLVEGRSDVAALTALLRGAAIGGIQEVRLVDMGGATNIRRQVELFASPGRARRILGLCDAHEVPVFARALAASGVPLDTARAGLDRSPTQGCGGLLDTRTEMARYAHRCVTSSGRSRLRSRRRQALRCNHSRAPGGSAEPTGQSVRALRSVQTLSRRDCMLARNTDA